MNKTLPVVLQVCAAVWLATLFSCNANAAARLDQPPASAVVFFDVLDFPARVDEPKLSKSDKEFVLDCAVANRSGEPLLGIRLILLVIDPAGKLRNRITWLARAEVPMYSIKTFIFHPEITGELRSTDRLFLGIDEVIGRETIWRAAEAEKALRAYARGQHDVVVTVRTLANKYDRPRVLALPLLQRKD
jgi:hypothetical protein